MSSGRISKPFVLEPEAVGTGLLTAQSISRNLNRSWKWSYGAAETRRFSVAEVCRRPGYGRDLIYRHFPEHCHAISQAHARWRAARSARRKQVLSDEVRRVVVSLHEAGREPTLTEVASRLTTPGSMRERLAREVLAQIRLELGPVRH